MNVIFPQHIKRSDYAKLERHCVAVAKRHPGVCSVLRIGSITSPGISDLDLVIVLKDGVLPPKELSAKVLDPSGLIIEHDPVFVQESLAAIFSNVVPVFDVKVLFGPASIKITPKESAEYLFFSLVNLFYPREIFDLSVRKNINIRHALKRLNHLNHLMKLYDLFSKDRYTLPVTNKIADLRKNWEHLRVSDLYEVINQSLVEVQEFLYYVAANRSTYHNNAYVTSRHTVWYRDCSPKQALLKTRRIYCLTGLRSSILPTPYAAFYTAQAPVLLRTTFVRGLQRPLLEKNAFSEGHAQTEAFARLVMRDVRFSNLATQHLNRPSGFKSRVKLIYKRAIMRLVP